MRAVDWISDHTKWSWLVLTRLDIESLNIQFHHRAEDQKAQVKHEFQIVMLSCCWAVELLGSKVLPSVPLAGRTMQAPRVASHSTKSPSGDFQFPSKIPHPQDSTSKINIDQLFFIYTLWPYLILFDFIWSPPTIWSHSCEDMEPQWTTMIPAAQRITAHSAQATSFDCSLTCFSACQQAVKSGLIRSHSPVVAVVGCWTNLNIGIIGIGSMVCRTSDWRSDTRSRDAHSTFRRKSWRLEKKWEHSDKMRQVLIWFHMLSELRWADPDGALGFWSEYEAGVCPVSLRPLPGPGSKQWWRMVALRPKWRAPSRCPGTLAQNQCTNMHQPILEGSIQW